MTLARNTRLSGLEPLQITPDTNFVNVGERTNVTGSAQFRPIASGCACRSEYQKASAVCPERVRPEASVMVPEIITGRRAPISANTSSIANSAALALRGSNTVSTISTSLPPSTRPRAASR